MVARLRLGVLASLAILLGGCVGGASLDQAAACPPDSVRAGTVCLDKFEASVWRIPPPSTPTGETAIRKIRAGTVTRADLTAAGALQLGLAHRDLAANACFDTGNGCVDVYAVSIAGVQPAGFITWFQATAAARNSFKRLPTNAEWQAGALGTPDPGVGTGMDECNTTSASGIPALTGSRAHCVSDVGAFDMVGNVAEWVADWAPGLPQCGQWNSWIALTGDLQCYAGAFGGEVPGALFRGGTLQNSVVAGVFAVRADDTLLVAQAIGFRAAR